MGKITTSFVLDEELRDALEALAKRNARTRSHEARLGLRWWVAVSRAAQEAGKDVQVVLQDVVNELSKQ